METQPFILERTFDAPVSNVWRALTEINLMKQWYFDLQDFRAEIGFEFSFEGGACRTPNVHLCKVTEVVVGKRLSYSWRYEGYQGDSLVSFELIEVDKRKTTLRLTHTGLESFEHHHPGLFSRDSFATGWTHFVGNALTAFLEKNSIESYI